MKTDCEIKTEPDEVFRPVIHMPQPLPIDLVVPSVPDPKTKQSFFLGFAIFVLHVIIGLGVPVACLAGYAAYEYKTVLFDLISQEESLYNLPIRRHQSHIESGTRTVDITDSY